MIGPAGIGLTQQQALDFSTGWSLLESRDKVLSGVICSRIEAIQKIIGKLPVDDSMRLFLAAEYGVLKHVAKEYARCCLGDGVGNVSKTVTFAFLTGCGIEA